MKLIAGLGNPGEKYQDTRHNVGFFVLDRLSESGNVGEVAGDPALVVWHEDKGVYTLKISLAPEAAVLAKPQEYMNESGKAVKFICQKHKVLPQAVLVIHDDLDIPLGSYKLQFGKGPRLHNGVTSVENYLGSKDFWRLRVGIENRGQKVAGQQGRSTGEDYVLDKFSKEELEVLESITTQKLIPEVSRWISSLSD